jgi:hypothetical protein
MTTYFLEQTTCGSCGHSADQKNLASTSTMGEPDLDLRPASPQRFTMDVWVQECSACGYCAPELASTQPELVSTVLTPEYQALVRDRHVPDLVRRFRAYASLIEPIDKNKAARAHLWAAWVYDDEIKLKESAEERRSALRLWSAASPGAPGAGTKEGLIQIDVLRRIGEPSEALKRADELLARDTASDVERKVLMFQRQLCMASDTERHTLRDVFAQFGNPPPRPPDPSLVLRLMRDAANRLPADAPERARLNRMDAVELAADEDKVLETLHELLTDLDEVGTSLKARGSFWSDLRTIAERLNMPDRALYFRERHMQALRALRKAD